MIAMFCRMTVQTLESVKRMIEYIWNIWICFVFAVKLRQHLFLNNLEFQNSTVSQVQGQSKNQKRKFYPVGNRPQDTLCPRKGSNPWPSPSETRALLLCYVNLFPSTNNIYLKRPNAFTLMYGEQQERSRVRDNASLLFFRVLFVYMLLWCVVI